MFLEVHFMEMIKSSSPIWVLLVSVCAGVETMRWSLVFVIVTISFGLGLATYGEIHFNAIGFTLCMFAAIIVGFRLVLMHLLVHKPDRQMDSMALLFVMSPVCALSIIPAAVTLELQDLLESEFIQDREILAQTTGLVLFGAFIALNLHLSEVLMVRSTSALSSNIAALFKVVMIIIASSVIFKAPVTSLNVLGLSVCLVGMMGYNAIKLVKMGVLKTPWSPKQNDTLQGLDDAPTCVLVLDTHNGEVDVENCSCELHSRSSSQVKANLAKPNVPSPKPGTTVRKWLPSQKASPFGPSQSQAGDVEMQPLLD
eukprot:CAMPEP_0114544508 /NCGR_PEP_ID=MMETSP0114-20121206/2915_1 /TAXON_ID=31324 /ORGANISM="Goniomonas sp, Strain m" /LENGTH=311 /DNA_ID=CAMNT_0001728895 /DNA_START=266 /DNA_END=1201 /DNA_ORIENTATION=+